MGKVTKNSQDPTTDAAEPSTSSATSPKANTRLSQPKTKTAGKAGGKTLGLSNSKGSGKVQKTTKKGKKTPPRCPKRKAVEKTTTPTRETKTAKREVLFGHYRRMMDKLATGTETAPDHNSLDVSGVPTSDLEDLESQ